VEAKGGSDTIIMMGFLAHAQKSLPRRNVLEKKDTVRLIAATIFQMDLYKLQSHPLEAD
jgi:hypothetical protein